MLNKDYMGAEPNNAQEGIKMDIDVYEIDKDVNEYRKILNELKIFMYKFSIGNYDENEKKRRIFELGSDEYN
ncbi:hypothetical protein BDAP_000140 [Binucleata daphniae]